MAKEAKVLLGESPLACVVPRTEGYLLSFHRLLLLQEVTEPELQAVTLLDGLFKLGLHVVNLKVQMEVRQNHTVLATLPPLSPARLCIHKVRKSR